MLFPAEVSTSKTGHDCALGAVGVVAVWRHDLASPASPGGYTAPWVLDVWYVEDSDRLVYHPTTYWPTFECDANVAYLARQMHSLGLDDRWIFRPPGVSDKCYGARDMAGLRSLYREADAVFNLCGAQELHPEHRDVRLPGLSRNGSRGESGWCGDRTPSDY